MKKGFIFLFMGFYLIGLVCALNVDVVSVTDSIVNDANEPAVFEFDISGEDGEYEIYTFQRFDISPESFNLDNQKTIRVEFLPRGSMKENTGHTPFTVFIKNSKDEVVYEEELAIDLVGFEELFSVKTEEINYDSEFAKVFFYNIEDFSYTNLHVTFTSPIFDDKQVILNMDPFEKKEIEVPIDKSALRKLVYGNYVVKAIYTVDGRTDEVEGSLKILEKSGITTQEYESGLIIQEDVIKKTNEGNVPVVADVMVKKNIISRLFSSFSPEPNRSERDGFLVYYYWQKELQPAESLDVDVKTNLIFPLILIFLIGVIVYLFNKFISTNLLIKKKVNFVKTKDGRFALRVTLRLKARKFLDKVVLYDRMPAMTDLFEKYGEKPSEVKNGRIRWDVGRLGAGEERFFSYIMHSKLKIVGKFELPQATGIYETEGRLHEASSNRVFFINEPNDLKEE